MSTNITMTYAEFVEHIKKNNKDKSSIAYVLDAIGGAHSMYGVFVDSYLKKELKQRLDKVLEENPARVIKKIGQFNTNKHINIIL